MLSSMKVSDVCLSGFVEFLFALLAAGAVPVGGQFFEGHTVMLGRVVDIAADRAYILAGGFLLGEIHFGQCGLYGVVEVHHAFCL